MAGGWVGKMADCDRWAAKMADWGLSKMADWWAVKMAAGVPRWLAVWQP